MAEVTVTLDEHDLASIDIAFAGMNATLAAAYRITDIPLISRGTINDMRQQMFKTLAKLNKAAGK